VKIDVVEDYMAEKKRVPFTREGYERVSRELKELVEVKRPEIIEAVADARSHGDLRENAAYDVARQDQAMIEKRISDLEEQLRNAQIIEDDPNGATSGIVSLGRSITVDFDGEEEVYKLVGPAEAMPTRGLISEESPMGKQLKGRKVGDKVIVETPGGPAKILIKAVD
jgi:transcription elongation factor GreA